MNELKTKNINGMVNFVMVLHSMQEKIATLAKGKTGASLVDPVKMFTGEAPYQLEPDTEGQKLIMDKIGGLERAIDTATKSGAESSGTAMWLRNLFSFVFNKSPGSALMGEDNKAAVANSSASRKLRTVRHIGIGLRFLQEQVRSAVLKVIYVPTGHNLADHFSKALGPILFWKLIPYMMEVSANHNQ